MTPEPRILNLESYLATALANAGAAKEDTTNDTLKAFFDGKIQAILEFGALLQSHGVIAEDEQ